MLYRMIQGTLPNRAPHRTFLSLQRE